MKIITIDRALLEQALEFLDNEFGWSPGEAPRIDALRAALAQEQAEPVVRGAAYADALRSAIKACGAVQRDDGVWFGDDAAVKLARVLSEGIAPPRRTMVPLTEEEIFAIENDIPDAVVSDRAWTIWFARAVERKLEEKSRGR